SYDGRYYQLQDAPFRPRPIQQPRPPLTLGAHGRKMLRIVAEHVDRWNSHGSVKEIRERNDILNEHCAAIGRDPASIERSLYGWSTLLPADPWASVEAFHEVIGQYRAAGIQEFLIDAPRDDQRATFERIAHEVIPSLRRAATTAEG
ncbi:MAG TPA: LLM class flavin-dependent oxidoreductase, partial [Thermomicrobiales bacterium]|nr:LLM class flavin-dependent oxidoreductase [Thermomicrobiales bacterium]